MDLLGLRSTELQHQHFAESQLLAKDSRPPDGFMIYYNYSRIIFNIHSSKLVHWKRTNGKEQQFP